MIKGRQAQEPLCLYVNEVRVELSRFSPAVAVVSVERTIPRHLYLDCRGLVRVAVVSVERTVPRQSFLTSCVAENQLSRYSPCRGTVRLP